MHTVNLILDTGKLSLWCPPNQNYLLQVGDQILEVNGQSFVAISHDEAVHILKRGCHLLIKVRDVGRLPHARTAADEPKWICSHAIAETGATANPGSVHNPTVSASVSSSNCSTR